MALEWIIKAIKYLNEKHLHTQIYIKRVLKYTEKYYYLFKKHNYEILWIRKYEGKCM